VSVLLTGLSFNHGAAGSPTIALRRNRTQPLSSPEWRPESQGAGVACYALDRLAGSSITVRAHLAATGTDAGANIEVRAVPYAAPLVPFARWPSSIAAALTWPSPGSAAYWLALYDVLARAGTDAPAVSEFGEIAPHAVTLPPAGPAVHDFSVSSSDLSAHGVNAHVVRWRWQFRRQATDMWGDFAFTQFTIYTVLTTPTLPWVQAPASPANTQLPWLDVLAVACRWAAGAITVDAAAARITEAVNGLGRTGILAYDCEGGDLTSIGTPHYTLLPGVFDCSEFLERVLGGLGNGRSVNCSDCASAVSTFANILGCDLSQSRMFGPVPFPLNPTRSIGSPSWLSACTVGVFSMHEVAWTGDCGQDDHVYDACLEIDGDTDPTRAPHSAQLPINLRFGAPGEGLYRDRLVSPPGRLICQPQPAFRQRRFVV
jgi:hypothetical protein